MLKYGLLIVLSLVAMVSKAEIYKWTDSSGIVHFSDKPHPGATSINLPEAPVASTASPEQTENNEAPPLEKKAEAVVEYESISISQPKNEETIRNNQGYVPVITEISPDLHTGDSLQLLFDGKAIGDPQSALVFTLKDVNRGAHTLAVQVVDASQAVLATSESVTFYMQRPRVGMGQPAN